MGEAHKESNYSGILRMRLVPKIVVKLEGRCNPVRTLFCKLNIHLRPPVFNSDPLQFLTALSSEKIDSTSSMLEYVVIHGIQLPYLPVLISPPDFAFLIVQA